MSKVLKVLNENKREIALSIISIVACFTYFYVSKIIDLPYFRASFIKIVMFIIIPTLYLFMIKERKAVKEFFKIQSIKDIKVGIITVIGVIVISTISLFTISNVEFFENLAKEASNTIKMSLTKYIITSIYIVCVNALVEEYFFRGIVFLQLSKGKNKKFAMFFSALLFSLYHIAIFEPGMHFIMYLLGYLGLFITGIIFNCMDIKSKTIYNSWFVHAIANSSINTIGLYILLRLK